MDGDTVIITGCLNYWGAQFGAYGDLTGSTYDMSKVAKATFDAKASESGTGLIFSLRKGDDYVNELKDFTVTTEWQTFTLSVTKTVEEGTPEIFRLQGITDDGAVVGGKDVKTYIRNVAFYDANGKEIVPTIIQN